MKQRGYLLLVLASLCIGTLPIAGKFGLQQNVPVFALLVSRTAMAAIVLALMLRIWQPHLLSINRQQLQRCTELAIVNCFSMFFYLQAINRLDASFSVILFAFIFIPFVIMLNRVWGQQPRWVDGFRFALAMVGIYFFVDPSGTFSWMGVLFGVGNATAYGVYTVLIERRLGNVPPMTILVYSMAIQAIIFSIVGAFFGIKWPSLSDTTSWATMVWFGLISTGLARVFLFSGIQIIGSKQAALFSPLDMVIALALSVLFLNETLNAVQIGAALLIMLSVLLANWDPKSTMEVETA